MANINAEKAAAIIENVGGKENITLATHCMTRLRLTLKDESKADDEKIKAIDGILGVAHSGGQYQIIVGQSVPKVYDEVIKMTGLSAVEAIDEDLDTPKEKLTLKNIGKKILDYLSGSMTQMIPVMTAAAMFKTINVLFGPGMLNLMTEQSDLYILMNLLYDAGYYFMPIYLGYCAAKKLGVSPVLGLYMGGVLIVPGLIDIVNAGQPFTVYGIPMRLVNYGQSVVPVLLCVWILSYVEKFFKKVTPDSLSTIFVPFLTMAVMIPVGLCALAPVGNLCGDYFGMFFDWFSHHGGFLAVAVIAALWEYLVMTGMHGVVLMAGIMNLISGIPDSCVMIGGGLATSAAFGMALGAFLRLRDPKEKSLAFSYFIAGFIGGVTEPVLYGIGTKYKRPFIALSVAGFVAGIYAGLTHVTCYVLGSTNFLGMFVGYVAGGTANLVNGLIAGFIALFGTAALTYLIGFDKNEPAIQKQAN